LIHLQQIFDASAGLEKPQADIELVVAQVEERAIELARETQRIPVGISLKNDLLGALDRDFCRPCRRVQLDLDQPAFPKRGKRNSGSAGAVRLPGQL